MLQILQSFQKQSCKKITIVPLIIIKRPASATTKKEVATKTPAIPVADSVDEQEFKRWYMNARTKLKSSTGSVYLGGNIPFPFNPDFQPNAPLTNAFKIVIYNKWKSDPQKWTLRMLSGHYKVSIDRCKAIIKQKALLEQMLMVGFKVNKSYVQNMEIIMGAKDQLQKREVEVEETTDLKFVRPKLISIQDNKDITHNDAARILKQKLKPFYSQINKDIIADQPYLPFPKPDGVLDTNGLLIKNDLYETSRWKFVFLNTSGNPTITMKSKAKINYNQVKEILIRERNGDLRHGHPVEKERILRNHISHEKQVSR